MANNPPPYSQDPANTPNFSSISSIMQSLKSQDGAFPSPTVAPSTDSNPSPSTASSVVPPSTFASSTDTPTASTLSTVTSPSDLSNTSLITSTASIASSSASTAGANTGTGSGSGTGVNTHSSATAAGSSSTGTGGVISETECSSVSCSPGLQAAVAVPVVVGTLAILGFIFFLVRRRRRGRTSNSPALGSGTPRKKWTRHLRIFSFDTELLMGGRFSSTNSIRSGPSSHRDVRSLNQARHTDHPSIHSIEDVAPPYRDAVSHANQPNMSQVAAGAAVGAVAAGMGHRPSSGASAPPPYGSTASQRSNRSVVDTATPVDTHRNPFADSNPVSPVDANEWSPFNDPSEDGSSTRSRPVVSRASSMRTGNDRDGISNLAASDAGSIREAQIGRHVSIASGGRTISNIRSSQSPTSSMNDMGNGN